MRQIVRCIPWLFALPVVAGCNGSKSGDSISPAAPGFQEIGVDWDGTSGGSTFMIMAGFASSPGSIVQIPIVSATSAADVADQIEAYWSSTPGIQSFPVDACGEHIVLFPEDNVGSFAVLDSDGTWRPITSTTTYVTLTNGLKVRKKVGPCAE